MTSHPPTSDPEPQNQIANAANTEINYTPISQSPSNIIADEPLIDLRRYDRSKFDRGRSGWLILVWWFVQAIVFPLTPHPFNGIRRWLLRLFGAKIGCSVIIRPTARFTYP